MNVFLTCSILLFTTASVSVGQVNNPSLAHDATFKRTLLALARYPKTAQKAGKSAKLYVDFTIDKQGRVKDVGFLNNTPVDPTFTEAVGQLMKQLPVQKSTYAGEYVLPVIFELEHEPGKQNGAYQPTEADRAAFDRTFVQLSHDRSLLSELYVTAHAR